MQGHLNRVFADGLDVTFGNPDHGLLHRGKAGLVQGVGDVGVGDGAEQAAVHTGLLGERELATGQFFAFGLGSSQFLGLDAFQLGTTGLELGHGGLGGTTGLALRDQVVAGVAIANLDDVTQLAEVDDFFKQNNLHHALLPGRAPPSAKAGTAAAPRWGYQWLSV